MTPEAKQALQGSINHWERLANEERKPGEVIGLNSCDLCNKFFGRMCKGCPVYEKTGGIFCSSSPYVKIMRLMEYRDTKTTDFQFYSSPEFLAAAKEELSFLQSLMPQEEAEELEIDF